MNNYKLLIKKFSLIFIFFIILFIPQILLAQTGADEIWQPAPVNFENINPQNVSTIKIGSGIEITIIKIILELLGIWAIKMLIDGFFGYYNSSGEEDAIYNARNTSLTGSALFAAVIIGFIAVYNLAWFKAF